MSALGRFHCSIERWRRDWEFYLEEFWPFNAFVMLQIRFSNHWLIKSSMIYLYIKPEVKKNDTTAMTTIINEACFGWLHENYSLVRGVFLLRKPNIFLLLGWILPLLTGFPLNGRVGGMSRTVHTWWGQQDQRRGNIFGKMRDTRGHCLDTVL